MTPADLYDHLCCLGVVLTPKPEGKLYISAPVGVLTPALKAAMAHCKPALWVLAQPPQQGTFLPWPPFRTWVTGTVPQNGAALISGPLPPPTVRDTPSPAKTVIGQPCTNNKQCAPSAQYPSGKPASLRYQRTGLCVACLERLLKERN